jgi:hypothetical protein
MDNEWSYGNFQIREGLKPESSHFQYFFIVSQGGAKKCRLCVWITDDALAGFDPSRAFVPIAHSGREKWCEWVRNKIDQGDFRDRVLRFDPAGRQEIDLREMTEKLKAG